MRKIRFTAAIVTGLVLSLCSCAVRDWAFGILEPEEESAEPAEYAENSDDMPNDVINDISAGVVDFDTYNPLMTKSPTMRDVCGFIFEPLFSMDAGLHAVSVLVSTYSVSENGMELAIALKENVKWHDGSELVSDDVVYTVNYIKSGSTNYTQFLEPVTGVWKTGKYTLGVSFSRPVAYPEAIMTFPIVQNGSRTDNMQDYPPVGTGPFMLSSIAEGRHRLSAFPDHHETRALLDGINVEFIPDKDKYLSLFGANEIDFSTSDMIDMTTFMPRGNTGMQEITSNKLVIAGFNTTSQMFADARTRRAISLLIDRDTIVSRVFYSRARACNYAINPDSWLNFDTSKRFRADDTAAAALLSEAGWSTDSRGIYCAEQNGRMYYLTPGIYVNSESSQMVRAAELIRDKLQSAGISATIVRKSFGEYSSAVEQRGYDMFLGEIELMPNGDMSPLASSAGNCFGYANADTDALLTQMGIARSEDDMKAVAISLHERLMSETPFAPICFERASFVIGSKIKYGAEASAGAFVRLTENWGVK